MRASAPAPGTDVVAGARTLLGVAAAHVVAIAGALALFERWHGRPAFADAPAQPGGWPGAIAAFVAMAAVRELLHAAVWQRTSGLSWRAFTVRRSRRKLGVIVEPTAALCARDDRRGLVAPSLAFGVAPLVAGLVAGRGLALLWGAALAFEGWSDIAIAAATWRLPAGTPVLPIGSRLGRRVADAPAKRDWILPQSTLRQ